MSLQLDYTVSRRAGIKTSCVVFECRALRVMTGFSLRPLRMWSYEEVPIEWQQEPSVAMMEIAATRLGVPVSQVETVVGVTMPDCAMARAYIQWAGQHQHLGLGVCLEHPSNWLQGRNQSLAEWGYYMLREGRPMPAWIRMWAKK